MPVIILTGHGDVPVAVEAMKGGAVEFLEKPYEKAALVRSIQNAFEQLENQSVSDLRSVEAQSKLTKLTPREREVLECLVDGLTNKAIADVLSISPRTIEIHRSNMMEKLEADSLSAALRIAFVAGVGMKDDG
jgi:two-component system response regulator FixJ